MTTPNAGDGGSSTDPGQQQGSPAPGKPAGAPPPGSADGSGDAGTDAGKTFTQAELEKIVGDRLKRERDKYAGYDELKAKAGKFDELQESQKSETQKLSDQLAAREVELAGLRAEQVRTGAGREAGLDPELWEFITAAEPATALEQAKRLKDRTAAPAAAPPPPGDLRQGARTPAPTGQSANDWFRSMAGRSSG